MVESALAEGDGMKRITLADLKATALPINSVPPPEEEVSEQVHFNRQASQQIDRLTHDVVMLIQMVEELRRGRGLSLVLS